MTAHDTSPPDLDAIEARANAASEGPWHTEEDVDGDDGPGMVFGPPREYVAETYTGDGSGRAVADAVAGGPAQQHANATFVARARADVPALVARVRDLAAKLDASAQAFDALVADVWRATGETHEPPADVAALLARVEGQREALDGYRLAAVDVVERIDGERQEPDFDMPAEFGAYVCDEVDHLRAAVAAEAHAREAAVAARARVERDVCEAAGEARDPRHDAADVVRRAVAAARREGAEAMREVCFAVCEDEGNTHNLTGAIPSRERDAREDGRRIGASRCAAAIRALPLPEAPPDASTYRRGAGAMMEACAQAVTGDGADVLRRQRDEEQAAWEREHGGEP